jgi:hypothetical protein
MTAEPRPRANTAPDLAPPTTADAPPDSGATGVDFTPGLREDVKHLARAAVTDEARAQALAAVAEALAPLRQQIRDLEVRLARAESQLNADPTLAEAPRKVPAVSPVAASVTHAAAPPPPALFAQASLAPVSAMPIKVISSPPPPMEPVPATVVMPNRPAAPAAPPAAIEASVVKAAPAPTFDLTPDLRDLPDGFDGQARQRRLVMFVGVVLVLGVGALLAAMFASRP